MSGWATTVIVANITAKPSKAKLLWVISKKPLPISLATTARFSVNGVVDFMKKEVD
jgi:hypothetical protein